MKLLVTGGAGFIGSNFIHYILEQQANIQIVNFDCLSYAGNLENLNSISSDPRYTFVRGDIASAEDVERCLTQDFNAVINFAAETHVDRSILDASSFVRTNVQGTQVLLETCRRNKIDRFLQISTDEVYGSLGNTGQFTEDSPLAPNNPYAASKAAADLLVRAYHKTYNMNVVVTRCSNNYGPYQFPEKLIPLMILNALDDKPLPIYGDGLHTRDWIHTRDHCRALENILNRGYPGRIYNIGANQEYQNLHVVHRILDVLGESSDLINFVKDRPGHDRRYAVDPGLLEKELGWKAETDFEEGLIETINWYRNHSEWIHNVCQGTYRNYYQKMYVDRGRTLSDL